MEIGKMYDVMLDEAKLCLDELKGTNLQFRAVEKVNAEAVSFVNYYITLEAVDPDNNHSLVAFQTCVWDSATENKERLRLITKQCRIKPPQVTFFSFVTTRGSLWRWDPNAVDKFYTGVMPSWLQDDDALTGPNKLQFHARVFIICESCCSEWFMGLIQKLQVKDSELQDNEWLNLYAEIALSSERPDMETYLPLKVKKVVVRTKEDVEPSMKLKSSNAIFYMTFKTHRGHECKAIIRQTRDGIQGHMCLEVTCILGK
ncbi:unnamed protein product [Brassica napus]|uniref:(rape) hypothetical protein n=1 Tax=Brassica napus TaxID=3708 RepID=A0A816RAB0_BRANA|nr:unnamed protein product [Brassica napus]